jgi:hypothetical protein
LVRAVLSKESRVVQFLEEISNPCHPNVTRRCLAQMVRSWRDITPEQVLAVAFSGHLRLLRPEPLSSTWALFLFDGASGTNHLCRRTNHIPSKGSIDIARGKRFFGEIDAGFREECAVLRLGGGKGTAIPNSRSQLTSSRSCDWTALFWAMESVNCDLSLRLFVTWSILSASTHIVDLTLPGSSRTQDHGSSKKAKII